MIYIKPKSEPRPSKQSNLTLPKNSLEYIEASADLDADRRRALDKGVANPTLTEFVRLRVVEFLNNN